MSVAFQLFASLASYLLDANDSVAAGPRRVDTWPVMYGRKITHTVKRFPHASNFNRNSQVG